MCGVLCLFQIIMTLYKSVLMTIECVQAECADSFFCDMLEIFSHSMSCLLPLSRHVRKA